MDTATLKKLNEVIAELADGMQGDDDASAKNFSEIWKLCKPTIDCVVRQRVFNESEIEDITQEAFLKCWRKRNSYNKEKGEFLTWLIVIAQHTATDKLRSLKRRNEFHQEFENAEIHRARCTDNLHPSETRDYISVVLSKLKSSLPSQMFEIIKLRTSGCSLKEIAKEKHTTNATIKTRATRARKKIRSLNFRGI